MLRGSASSTEPQSPGNSAGAFPMALPWKPGAAEGGFLRSDRAGQWRDEGSR